MLALNVRILTAFSILLITLFFVVQAAFAAPGNSGTTKPGWGFGDKNHIHVGPPGQSVIVQNNSVHVENNVQVSSNTGNNSGNGSIVTGVSHVVISIVNFLGFNITS